MRKFSDEFHISLPPGLPPRSLKEIYQLPHKGKNEDEEDGGMIFRTSTLVSSWVWRARRTSAM